MKEKISITLDRELLKKLRNEAKKENRTLSNLINKKLGEK